MAEQGEVPRATTPDAMQHVERVYEAEYRMKAQRMEALQEHYFETTGLITLTSVDASRCHAHLRRELIRIKLAEMPYLQITLLKEEDFSIINPCTVPEPCQKHPYQMVLPNEYTVSSLPINEIHRELAIYALQNDTNFIASENALTCLTQWSRAWRVPFSVCDTIGPDGNRKNVLVLDSEFSVQKEAAPIRTYKAFRHLLEHALKPSLERERIYEAATGQNPDVDSDDGYPCVGADASEESAADLENINFVYLVGPTKAEPGSPELGFMIPNKSSHLSRQARTSSPMGSIRQSSSEEAVQVPNVGLRNCTCTDGNLPLRSFRKWHFFKEGTTELRLDIIVHSSHKGKDLLGELLLEPQPDIGADALSPDAVRRAAMSLMLNRPARLLNVRLHGPTGKVENFETLTAKSFARRHCDAKRQIIDTILTVLVQLRDLKPGHYVLQHEANDGPSAATVKLAPRPMRAWDFDTDQMTEGFEPRVANLSYAAAAMQPSTSGASTSGASTSFDRRPN